MSSDGAAHLIDSLVHFRCTHSTDLRDKVYALLGFVSDPLGIVPDYRKSEEQLFTEVSLALINASATLDIICQNHWVGARYDASGVDDYYEKNLRFAPALKSRRLPTWVADFSYQASSRDLQTHFLFAQRSTFSASKLFCRVPCKTHSGGLHLELHGVVIDEISEIHDGQGKGWSRGGHSQPEAWRGSVLGRSASTNAITATDRYKATGETQFRAFWRTVTRTAPHTQSVGSRSMS